MLKGAKPKAGALGGELKMPPLVKVLALPCSEQMQVYNRAVAQLDHNLRHRLKRRGRKPFPVPELNALIAAISTYWQEQRRLCQLDPDYFKWPSTIAWIGGGPFADSNLEQEGALKLFGYAVSNMEDLSDQERQYRLDTVFGAVIPPFTSWDRVAEWGEPRSAARLKKMANCLAAFARNGARRRADWMEGPVAKWREDLGYLRKKYYRDKFGFDWPTTI